MCRPNWNQYFMTMAEIASSRATCPRAAVGAVIVKNNHVLVTGYNGAIHKADHCTDVGCKIVNNHCIRTVHAEMNAILNCARQGSDLQDSELYVTHFPCVRCMPLVLQAGINKIYYLHAYNIDPFCIELAKQTGCELIQLESELTTIYNNLGKVSN